MKAKLQLITIIAGVYFKCNFFGSHENLLQKKSS